MAPTEQDKMSDEELTKAIYEAMQVPYLSERHDAIKQLITSVIKELVAEAKPFDYVPEGHEPDSCLNHEKYTSACCGCQKQRARVYALGEYQYNLLKAL